MICRKVYREDMQRTDKIKVIVFKSKTFVET